jgi:hypothetical protein
VYSQAHLNKVARQLNERPRKTLGFETPAEKFNACVASGQIEIPQCSRTEVCYRLGRQHRSGAGSAPA